MIVIVTLLALLAGIIVTGYLFSKSAQAAEHEDRGGQIISGSIQIPRVLSSDIVLC
jgi:hypothetical protein